MKEGGFGRKSRKTRGFPGNSKKEKKFLLQPLTGVDAAVELPPLKRRACAGAFALFFDNLAVNSSFNSDRYNRS